MKEIPCPWLVDLYIYIYIQDEKIPGDSHYHIPLRESLLNSDLPSNGMGESRCFFSRSAVQMLHP